MGFLFEKIVYLYGNNRCIELIFKLYLIWVDDKVWKGYF